MYSDRIIISKIEIKNYESVEKEKSLCFSCSC